MNPPAETPARAREERGFTILEIMIAIIVLVIGVVPMGALLVHVSQQREQTGLQIQVLNRAQSLMEEIRGADPAGIFDTYNGTTWLVDGVEGANEDDSVLAVAIDVTEPTLIVVDVMANWQVRDHVEGLALTTEIFDAAE